MKIALTGHTSGIGKAIYNRYNPNVIGFSRANGYDISNADHRKQIRDISKDCDIFINNAYSDFAQVDMLYLMYEAWANTNKLIINISSNSGDGIKNKAHLYAVAKTALDKSSEQLSRLNNACKIVNLRPGYVDTPRVANVTNMPKMSTNSILYCIDFIINCPDDCMINTMTVLPRKDH